MKPEEKMEMQFRVMSRDIETLQEASPYILIFMQETGIDGYFGVFDSVAEVRVHRGKLPEAIQWAESKGYNVDINDEFIIIFGLDFRFIVQGV